MQLAARQAGYDMQALRARQLQPSDFESFDLIVGMDAENLADIERMRPSGNATRALGLADYVEDADHIPDPYYTGEFDDVLRLIERSVDALIAAET